jgi:phosphomannomutase
MVTASHNPPAYNGYKVYWGNGAQIIPPHDQGIAAAIAKIGRSDQLPMPALDDARRAKTVVDLDEQLHERYLDAVIALRAQPDLDGTALPFGSADGRGQAPAVDGRSLVIAYTPLHGVGAASVEPAMQRAGFPHLHTEPSQRAPDPDFPTVAFPNPEEKGAMDLVLALAGRVKADLVLANDPDADRLSVAVPDGGGYRLLTGDQVGVLLADYLLTVSAKDKRMVATTIVSSQLLSYLAKQAGADYRETLTGFKWIGNAAMDYEREHHGRFVMGYEEALGYSVGPLVRDKDGVSACVVFA